MVGEAQAIEGDNQGRQDNQPEGDYPERVVVSPRMPACLRKLSVPARSVNT